MALDVSALADFNNQTAGKMIPKIVYTGNTAEYTSVQEGIKYLEPLNLFEVDLYVQEGYGCATTPSGSATFTQRNLQVCGRQSFDSLCLKDLDTKYLGITSLDAGSYNTTWKLAETYSELIVNQMKKKNDQFIWNATTAGAVDCADGLLELTEAGSGVVEVAAATTPTLTNIDLMIAAIPTDVADRDDLTLFMSVSYFRQYVANLRTANNYYFDPNAISNRGGVLDMVYPFQNVRVVGTAGLGASTRMVLAPAKQIVIGTDLVSDVDNFALWYDINTDSLRHRLSMKLGVQIAYPSFVVSNVA
tara:strand:- start:294 stop:1202 length:909 start_codon:yes stop_codon:yes gene_type:complete